MTTLNPRPQPITKIARGLAMRVVEGGFPHSEIHGSKPVRGSPWLIAAYHVLHRLSAPRHPPNALKALDRSHERYPRAMPEDLVQKDQLASNACRARAVRHGCSRDASRSPGPRPACIPSSRCQFFRNGRPSRAHPLAGAAISSLSQGCSFRMSCHRPGGARRDRTDDLMLAKHALSQLSYGPAPKALLAAVAGRPGRRPARPKAAAHVCASAKAAEAAAGA
jgi:hypothetical protein